MLNTLNRKISLFLFCISIFYLILSFRLPAYGYVPVDSDVIPISLGYLLLILSIVLFFLKDEENEKQKVTRGEMSVFLIVLGFILLFILLLEVIGFVLSTSLFIFCCSRFLGYKHWLSNAIVSVMTPLFIYVLFVSFLQIQLPKGILPF